MRKIVHTRLYRGEEDDLLELVPQMWDWSLSYLPPPVPLRRPRWRPSASAGRPDGYDPAERILRALASVVAEKGYPAMTVNDIASRASISLSTFYAHFADKEEAMLAAVDSGSAQMLATTLPAFRRALDWPATRCARPSARCLPSVQQSPSTRRWARSTSMPPAGGCWNGAIR